MQSTSLQNNSSYSKHLGLDIPLPLSASAPIPPPEKAAKGLSLMLHICVAQIGNGRLYHYDPFTFDDIFSSPSSTAIPIRWSTLCRPLSAHEHHTSLPSERSSLPMACHCQLAILTVAIDSLMLLCSESSTMIFRIDLNNT